MSQLTPDEVRDVVFDHAPVFRRGYDETQVDEFLDRVEEAMIALHRAAAENQQLLDSYAMRTEPAGRLVTTGEHRALADQVVADARRRADEIVDGARAAAQRVVAEARAEAFRLVANASRQIVGVGPAQLGDDRDRELAAAVAEVGDRIAHLREALSGEVAQLYEIAQELDGGR
ncbi:DivIVA domain-containing protein [Actinophytocola sp. NPDC049390]|uniref:DivIVA domain-containing protein n=1 Tax=Actinophytocola sp. NPDC049390 TaxID=3363894 RepID=UPI0037B841E9